MQRQSAFKDQMLFDADNWVITMFNAGDASGGHAALLVEGEDADGQLLIYRCEIFAAPFKRYLERVMDEDLSPGAPSRFAPLYRDFKSVIDSIEEQICYVKKKYYGAYPLISRGTFANCTSHSWPVKVADANKMLDGIDVEKASVDEATGIAIEMIQQNEIPDLTRFTLFKLYGRDSTLSPSAGQSDEGINCVNWCEKHLPHAGIAPASNILDSFAAKPEWHARQAHCGPYS